MKILIGVVIALVLALGTTVWQLRNSQQDRAVAQQQLVDAREALQKAGEQNAALAGRFDSLDTALGQLRASQNQNQLALANRLATIKNIVQESTDDPASIACLDVRVPAQLDRGLR